MAEQDLGLNELQEYNQVDNQEQLQDLGLEQFAGITTENKELLYLYHIYNLSVDHFVNHFAIKYNQEILCYVLHRASIPEATSTGTINDRTQEAIMMECKGDHIHVIIKLKHTLRDKNHKVNDWSKANSKWYGFQIYPLKDKGETDTVILEDGSIVGRKNIWNSVYPLQEGYKSVLIKTEQHFNFTKKYLLDRFNLSKKGKFLEKLDDINPNNVFFGLTDPRRKNIQSKVETSTDITTTTSSSIESKKAKVIAGQKKYMNDLTENYQLYKELFLDQGYRTPQEFKYKTNQTASPDMVKIYKNGIEAEKHFLSQALSEIEYMQFYLKHKLVCDTIKILLFHIILRRKDKDVFLLMQGPPSVAKSSVACSIAKAYPNVFDCNDMDAFLGRDNLGMEDAATEHCSSILCEEFVFLDRFGKGFKQIQNKLKQYLRGYVSRMRVRKNTKEKLNDMVYIMLIVATTNNELIRDADIFLKDAGTKERTILARYKEEYLIEFLKIKLDQNKVPHDMFYRFAFSIRKDIESLLSIEDLTDIVAYMKDSWYIHNLIDISYNAIKALDIINKMNILDNSITIPTLSSEPFSDEED